MSAPDLHLSLRRLFGHREFLPGQEDIVRRAVAGRDTLALMPTGSGKSLPYQLAAMLRDGPTLVVSPLIALMKDQVDKLPPLVAARSALINSSLDRSEAAERLEAFASGEIKLLYAAPERLRQRHFVAALAAARVGLVVVDEVHCVTMWGHDFRPDYLFIRRAVAELGDPTILGLTATATPATEREIAASLGRDFDVVRASVVRPNLHHAVVEADTEEDRRRALLARVTDAGGPAIVYTRSRKKTEDVARMLRGHRIRAVHYHAGMEPRERAEAQEQFISGAVDVVVATIAFGMGIDKPDIRLVLLYNLPHSLEDYVQMVGRAGRDGRDSACVLFTGDRDARDLQRFARKDVPRVEVLRDVYRRVRAEAHDGVAFVDPDDVAVEDDPRVLVGMLEQAGLVRRAFDEGRRMCLQLLDPPVDSADRMAALVRRYANEAVRRAARIVAYAESHTCRQRQIAEHFGERLDHACGVCDGCAPPPAAEVGVVAFAPGAGSVPDDVAATILRAVERLRWPLGQTGLAAMLSGSVAAPPSARRSPDFGVLAAASASAVKRELKRLLESGHLAQYESDDGYRLLRRTSLPPPEPQVAAPPDAGVLARLKAWRLETARAQDVPAYVVFSDRALEGIAAAQPVDERTLGDVHGVGPTKLERYGADVLRVVASDGG